MRRLMAGYERPTIERTKAILRDISIADASDLHFFHEFLQQLSPRECRSFMHSTESTPREMARLMKRAHVTRPVLVIWINQYSDDPNWHDSEGMTVALAEQYRHANTVPFSPEFLEKMREKERGPANLKGSTVSRPSAWESPSRPQWRVQF